MCIKAHHHTSTILLLQKQPKKPKSTKRRRSTTTQDRETSGRKGDSIVTGGPHKYRYKYKYICQQTPRQTQIQNQIQIQMRDVVLYVVQRSTLHKCRFLSQVFHFIASEEDEKMVNNMERKLHRTIVMQCLQILFVQ